MKKVTRIFTIAALAFGMTMAVSCNKDPENEGGNGGNGGGNTENLPTTLDEQFTGGIPSTWTNIDADGDGYAWQNWLFLQDGSTSEPYDMAMSASYLNTIDAMTPDNYLVSPKIYIEEGATLSYEVGAIDQNYYEDHYAVLLGTVENGAFKSIATLKEENVPSPSTTTRTIDLSEYKGKSVCIAFRHYNCTDMYIMTIDNVKVTK